MPRTRLDISRPINELMELIDETMPSYNTEPTLLRNAVNELVTVHYSDVTDEYVQHRVTKSTLNPLLRAWFSPEKDPPPGAQNQVPQVFSSVPQDIVNAYLEAPVRPGVPYIRRFAVAPYLRPDYSMVYAPGYDTQTGVYVTTSAQPLPAVIEEAHVKVARDNLSWLFNEFALTHGTSRADCLALMLTPLITDIIPDEPIPAGVFMADRPGSGKTKLAELISLIGMGKRALIRSLPNGSDAMGKAITSILLSGAQPVVLFDNVKTNLSSDKIEGLITSRRVGDRLLGGNTDADLRNDSLWLFSMNSPSLSDDMLRRCVFVALSPETAETRAPWTGGPIMEVLPRISAFRMYLAALVAWWVQCGKPVGSVTMTGFEEWSKIISGILDCAGIGGFLEANVTAKDDVHTETSDDAIILERIHTLITRELAKNDPSLERSDGFFRSKELEDLINDLFASDPNTVVLKQWAASRGGAGPSSRTIGQKLGALKGRTMGGYRLSVQKVPAANKSYFQVEAVGTDAQLKAAAAQGQTRVADAPINDLL